MNAPRTVLSGLDDAALEAAASKGLLRRAQRDREAGLACITAETPEAVTLAVDGETVNLGLGGLKTASCTCPSQILCRHVLTAVLQLREVPNPASEQAAPTMPQPSVDPVAEIAALSGADLARLFGRPTLREAEAILSASAVLPEEASFESSAGTCVIRLPGQPEVRYIAGLGLDGMISKRAGSAKALHAAAILAVRRLRAGDALGAAPPELDTGEIPAARAPNRAPETAFLKAVEEALMEAARNALATAPLLLEERLLDLALSSRADAMPRLAAALRGIAEDLAQRRGRVSLFEPDQALGAIAHAAALVQALRRDGDDPILRGALRQPYDEIASLELIGCGLEIWRTPTGARGVTAHCLAPDSGRWFSLTLARAADQDPYFAPTSAARSEPVFGRPLATLATRSFRLEQARATREGRLSLGGQTRLAWLGESWNGLIERRPELFLERWCDLPQRLGPAFSASVRAPRSTCPILLRPTALAPIQFDAVEQRAWLPVMDASGMWLDLTVRTDPDETRVDALDVLQTAGTPVLLAALAARESSDIVLSPFAALSKHDAEIRSFDLAETKTAPPVTGSLLTRLKRGLSEGLSNLGDRFGRTGPTFTRLAHSQPATLGLLAKADDEVLALAELGGRMEDWIRLDRLGALADRFEAAGLEPLGRLLSALAKAEAAERPKRLLAFIHASACHAALMTQPPLVERVR